MLFSNEVELMLTFNFCKKWVARLCGQVMR